MRDLFTIGYEGASQAALIKTLLENEIEVLLDIRELPLSRKPGFSKTALAAALEAHGIHYDHIRALGTPRDIRYQRKIDHDQEAFREDFLAYLATQDTAVDALVARAQRASCCLLCYEADFRLCHRLFVAGRAAERSEYTLRPVHLAVA